MTEAQLVQNAQKNPDQFAPLYELYVEKLFRYFFLRTGDWYLSEDLTSDTFTNVLRALPRYQIGKAPFGAWIFRIANNRLIDHYRIAKRETTVEEMPEIDAKVSIPEVTHSKLLYKEIEGLLENFSDQEREILLLKLSSGLKFSEIAEILGLNENTVKTKYFRSLKNLQAQAQHLKLLALIALLSSL